MDDLQRTMDDLLIAGPEMTFFEACSELVKSGVINYEATEDENVHAFLYQIFRQAKVRANTERVNKDM